MNRSLSNRTVSLIAIGLAVASAVFCWRWGLRYKAMVNKYETEVLLLQARQDDFEFHVLNLAAFLMNRDEARSGGERLLPITARLTGAHDAVAANPTLRAIERARADAFLYWYYGQSLPQNSGGSKATDAQKIELRNARQTADTSMPACVARSRILAR